MGTGSPSTARQPRKERSQAGRSNIRRTVGLPWMTGHFDPCSPWLRTCRGGGQKFGEIVCVAWTDERYWLIFCSRITENNRHRGTVAVSLPHPVQEGPHPGGPLSGPCGRRFDSSFAQSFALAGPFRLTVSETCKLSRSCWAGAMPPAESAFPLFALTVGPAQSRSTTAAVNSRQGPDHTFPSRPNPGRAADSE